jgi:hypothetical protein
MSDVQSPKPSDETRDASKAKGATATSTAPSTDDIDIAFGDPDPPPAPVRVSEPAKSAALRSTDPNPISQREIDPAPSAPQRTSSLGDRKSAPVSTGDRNSAPASKGDRPTAPRIVEVATSEQKKLEDIRRKLKDIFVTAEKPEPASDVVKASEQQTVSSGLLDLRHLAEARHGHQASKTDDDDLMNMSGGLFGSSRGSGSLAAPDFSKPTPPPPAPKPPPPVQVAKPVELADEAVFDVDPEPEPAPRKPVTTKPPSTRAPVVAEPNPFASPGMSGRTIVALTLAGALVFGGVFFMVMRGGDDDATQPTASTDSNVESQPAADQGQRVGQPAIDTPPAADPGSAAVVPGSKSATDDKPSKSGDGASTKGPGKTTAEPKDPKEPAAPTTPKPEATTAAPATAAPAPTEPPKATPPPPPAGNEFDKGAASAAMSAAASRAMACKGDGPSGTASVSVTFAPSGRVTSAKVDGGPFSGTPTGGCIATAFRSATVPPFDGSPITVRKSVSIR